MQETDFFMLHFLVLLSSAGCGEGKAIGALIKITAKFKKHGLTKYISMNPVGAWVSRACQLSQCRWKPPNFDTILNVPCFVKLFCGVVCCFPQNNC